MLGFLFKKETKVTKSAQLTEFLNNLKELYNYNSISAERKAYLTNLLDKYGYIPCLQKAQQLPFHNFVR